MLHALRPPPLHVYNSLFGTVRWIFVRDNSDRGATLLSNPAYCLRKHQELCHQVEETQLRVFGSASNAHSCTTCGYVELADVISSTRHCFRGKGEAAQSTGAEGYPKRDLLCNQGVARSVGRGETLLLARPQTRAAVRYLCGETVLPDGIVAALGVVRR